MKLGPPHVQSKGLPKPQESTRKHSRSGCCRFLFKHPAPPLVPPSHSRFRLPGNHALVSISPSSRDIVFFCEFFGPSMASSTIASGALVTLQELDSSSPHFKQGASLRVTGKLQEYNAETAIAIITDGGATLAVDTQHLRLNLRLGSLYQFIGELSIQPSNEGLLRARVGRNVDGMDLNLYQQSLKLLREFQAEQLNIQTR